MSKPASKEAGQATLNYEAKIAVRQNRMVPMSAISGQIKSTSLTTTGRGIN